MRGRSGVSEIISTLMMVSLTVVGSLLLYSYIHGYVHVEHLRIRHESITLTGYDSRDGGRVGGMLSIDNRTDGMLCAASCNPHRSPSSNGTEFIVLYIKNTSNNGISIGGIIINKAMHTWSGSMPPDGGTFSIVTGEDTAQATNEIPPLTTARILVKLSDRIEDIPLGSTIEVSIPLADSVYRDRSGR
ncbi:MAG: hypothetical protein NZ888_07190 [Candidatus Nitrosocaldus sp.]|nr:hypothetical protein [Candidatus Nitrosocaldus sp.]MDW8000410.1 hypothetical protein [Candidatus Nitrosocaldus sp.]